MCYKMNDKYLMVCEKLQGINVVQYLGSLHEYTEDMVATIVRQVLEALEYLHWLGFVYLGMEPDNIVLSDIRKLNVKLVDMGTAQRVSKLGTRIEAAGHPEFLPPEVISDEEVTTYADAWQVGVLMYILLSGTSPYRGDTVEETKLNISYIRYRFEPLYKESTQEATRLMMLLFKRDPQKRPGVEECIDHRWLLQTDHMSKKRSRAIFTHGSLQQYSDDYHSKKAKEATTDPALLGAFGMDPNRAAKSHHDMFTDL